MSKEKAKIFHLLFDKTHMTCFLSAVLIIVMVTVTYIILINKNQYKIFFSCRCQNIALYPLYKSQIKHKVHAKLWWSVRKHRSKKKRGKSPPKKQLVKYYSQQSFLFRDTVTPISRWRYFACNAKHAWRGRKGGGIEHPTSHVKLFFF